jgi:polysaccharide export outer membrane protein
LINTTNTGRQSRYGHAVCARDIRGSRVEYQVLRVRNTFAPQRRNNSVRCTILVNPTVWGSDPALCTIRKSTPIYLTRTLLLICWLAVPLSGCFGGSSVQTRVVADPPVSTQADHYTIGSDDVLDVLVWEEPQLSGRVRVASDGNITMPLINQVTAAGRTTQQLQDDLTNKFSPFVNDPKVTVRIYNPASRAFYALGEVAKPGRYPLMSGEVLSQGLAAAGGPTEYANLRKIKIVRRTDDSQIEITVNYNAVTKGDLSADVPLQRADTIMVP